MSGDSGGTQVIQPNVAPPPTASQSAAEYAAALPQIYQASLAYQPQFNELDYQSFAKLAPQYAAITDQINKQFNPYTAGLQEQLAKQASEGSSAQIPDWMRQQYTSDLNAQLGSNAGSPVGADYVSRGLMAQQQGYQQYYQNLGLSLSGRQPMAQGYTQPSSFNVSGQFGQNYGNDLAGYSAYNSANRPLLGQAGTPNWALGMNAAGNLMQGVGSFMKPKGTP